MAPLASPLPMLLRSYAPMLILFALAPVWSQPQGRSRDSITVYYHKQDEASAEVVLDAASTALPRLESTLGLHYAKPADRPSIRIDLARTQAEFNRLAGAEMKPWTQGVALSGQRRIVLKPLLPTVLRGVTAHELTHVLLDELADSLHAYPPRWLHEGLAKYAAEDFNQADREILGEAVVGRRLLTIEQMEQAFGGKREEVALAYAQAYTLVDYLHSLRSDGALKAADGSLKQFLSELALTHDEARALLRTYSLTREQIETAWHEAIAEKYLHHAIPYLTEGIILLAMGVLFLAVHALNTRRRRAIRERLQEEERLRRMFIIDRSRRDL